MKNGGRFLTTFFSGIVQENDLVTLGGYPGKLRDILGIWVEEQDALPHDVSNEFTYHGEKYPATLLCDLLHLEGAKQLDESGYGKDFYQGMPVLTRNSYGEGKAYYVATASDEKFYRKFLKDVCEEAGIRLALPVPEGVEVTARSRGEQKLWYLLNHNETPATVQLPIPTEDLLTGEKRTAGEITLAPKDAVILRRMQ